MHSPVNLYRNPPPPSMKERKKYKRPIWNRAYTIYNRCRHCRVGQGAPAPPNPLTRFQLGETGLFMLPTLISAAHAGVHSEIHISFKALRAYIGNSRTPFTHAGIDACMRPHFEFLIIGFLEWRTIHAKQIAHTCNDSTCADIGDAGGSMNMVSCYLLCVHPVMEMESFSPGGNIYLTLAVCGFTFIPSAS